MPKAHYCDPMLDIKAEDQWYAYAYGVGEFIFHKERGSILANMGSENPRIQPDLSQNPDLDMFTITMPGHVVGRESNSYYCVYAEGKYYWDSSI